MQIDNDSRILGSLLGEAIGDALGYPFEFSSQTPDQRVIFDLIPHDVDFDGREVSFYSDDTQMTRAVMEGLLNTPDVRTHFVEATAQVASRFMSWAKGPVGGHRSPGGTCMRGCHRIARGTPPLLAGNFDPATGGGCGAVMRSAPYGWLWSDDAWQAAEWAADHACMTHGAPIGQASAAALAAAVACAIPSEYPTSPRRIAETAFNAANVYDAGTAQMISDAIRLAYRGTPETDVHALDRFRGWAGHEAIAASIYCFLRHPEDYREAVLLAVNSPGDSDSLGAITGAISGAYLGASAIPAEWIERIEKRDELIDLARRFALI